MTDWFETPSPKSCETPATRACAVTRDVPIAASGRSMVTGLRYTNSRTSSTKTPIAISMGMRSCSPATVRSATVAAGPVTCTVTWAVGAGVVFDDVGDSVIGLVGTRRAQLARKTDRQHPGRLVLARQERAQLRCGEEVLNHHDICHVVAQRVHHLAVGGFVGGLEPGFVDKSDYEQVVRTRFVKRFGHLPGGDARRGVAGQDGERMPLGHLVQARERQRKCNRNRDPNPYHRPGPPHHKIG